jgi:hypothetical protein
MQIDSVVDIFNDLRLSEYLWDLELIKWLL